MGDLTSSSSSKRNSVVTSITNNEECKGRLIASGDGSFPHQSLGRIASRKHCKLGRVAAAPITSFLLEVAALEVVRRFSKAKCPIVWSSLQALQVICYPPFKWIQRWNPFGALVKGMQMMSRPLLVLSVATAFSDHSGSKDVCSDATQDSPGNSNSNTVLEPHMDSSPVQPNPNMSLGNEVSESLSSESWLLQVYKELENQGITLPERIDEEELKRFYAAAHGDFKCFLSSVKKTISWRENYRIISGQELETWSNLVFWHGVDVKHRPCLIVRLGLACMSLPFHDRPRFSQAIVSQVEYGVLHLVDIENPQVVVLVDCEGLSPLRVPMQIMRSCANLLQDHFPKRLGCVFVIRLPPVSRVLAQTFIQVLKPGTRQKLKILGKMYRSALSEYIQLLPSYLGSPCICTICAKHKICKRQESCTSEINSTESVADMTTDEVLPSLDLSYETDVAAYPNCNHALRSAVVGILMFWVTMALITGIFDPENRPTLRP